MHVPDLELLFFIICLETDSDTIFLYRLKLFNLFFRQTSSSQKIFPSPSSLPHLLLFFDEHGCFHKIIEIMINIYISIFMNNKEGERKGEEEFLIFKNYRAFEKREKHKKNVVVFQTETRSQKAKEEVQKE